MARAQLGHIVSAIAGKIQGLTFQNGLSGLILRRTPLKVGRQTDYCQTIKNINAIVSSSWKSLTAQQRSDWQLYAEYIRHSQRHNSNLIISGQACHFKINFYLQAYGLPLWDDPVFSNIPPEAISPNLAYAGGQFYIALQRSPVMSDEFIIAKLTAPIYSTSKHIANKTRLIIFTTQGNVNQIITAEYLARFGIVPTTGFTVGFEITSMSLVNGMFLPWSKGINII